VVPSVCDSVRDNPRISGTPEARDFKFCMHIEDYRGLHTTPLPQVTTSGNLFLSMPDETQTPTPPG